METLNWESIISAVVIGLVALLAVFRVNYLINEVSKLGDTLADIKTTLASMRDRVDVIWDVMPKTFDKHTIYVALPNIGRVAVSATPREESIRYRLVTEAPIDIGALIVHSKTSGFEKRELALLKGDVCTITEIAPNSFLLSVPTLDASVATKMMNEYLEWIDREYRYLSNIKDLYEQSILPAQHIDKAEGEAWLRGVMPETFLEDAYEDEDE